MASREEQRIIREARAGKASEQVKLGMRYLSGEGSFAVNPVTALHWLNRAALQGYEEAWLIIGRDISLDTVLRHDNPSCLVKWYERAYDSGIRQAGIVLASLILEHDYVPAGSDIRQNAWKVLQELASTNDSEAQWRLELYREKAKHKPFIELLQSQNSYFTGAPDDMHSLFENRESVSHNGQMTTERRLTDLAWDAGDVDAFLRLSLPLARSIAAISQSPNLNRQNITADDAMLLCRCAKALSHVPTHDSKEITRFWELAAQAGIAEAQFLLGMWLAEMNINGESTARRRPPAEQLSAAVTWLFAAAHQGTSAAWYVLAKIYQNKKIDPFVTKDVRSFFKRAADAGHTGAQLEFAKIVWNYADDTKVNVERAIYWLQQLAEQGNAEATAFLNAIATTATPAVWAQETLTKLDSRIDSLRRARLDLAAIFGLTQPEALLIDIHKMDCQNCILINIDAHYYRRTRRLILVSTDEQRRTLNHILHVFENVDCGPNGPEGSYRERFNRFKTDLALADLR